MESMNHLPDRTTSNTAWLATLILAAAACVSCGPQVIEGRPPFIGISSMQLVGETLSADFRISNQNEVAMNIDFMDITVRVNEVELASEQRAFQLAIDANSSEEVQVREFPEASTRDLLASLEAREVTSLPFSLTGSVRTREDGTLRFEQKGHLYPVPGKPGFFRSAVTQAEELRREDDL
jgi:LEA14-like dessication related protein